eukprot:Skav209223  [mRNA]  locus=scaffold3787:98755:101699:+ [translate_table: standard]
MSCLDGCCQSSVPATRPEVIEKVPDESAEAPGLHGLNVMIATPSPALVVSSNNSEEVIEEGEFSKSHASGVISHVSLHETVRTMDWDILRGISLRESLRRGGSLWRRNPTYLRPERRATLFHKSRHMKHAQGLEEFWTEPAKEDWLQTCLIFVAFVLYFMSGAWLLLQAYWTHTWELLPGSLVGTSARDHKGIGLQNGGCTCTGPVALPTLQHEVSI